MGGEFPKPSSPVIAAHSLGFHSFSPSQNLTQADNCPLGDRLVIGISKKFNE